MKRLITIFLLIILIVGIIELGTLSVWVLDRVLETNDRFDRIVLPVIRTAVSPLGVFCIDFPGGHIPLGWRVSRCLPLMERILILLIVTSIITVIFAGFLNYKKRKEIKDIENNEND